MSPQICELFLSIHLLRASNLKPFNEFVAILIASRPAWSVANLLIKNEIERVIETCAQSIGITFNPSMCFRGAGDSARHLSSFSHSEIISNHFSSIANDCQPFAFCYSLLVYNRVQLR